MTSGVASTDVSSSRATGWSHDPDAGVRPALDDLTASLGGDGEAPEVSENRWDGASGSSVADCAMGPGPTRPVPFAGGRLASRSPTVKVLVGGAETGLRRSVRLSPGLIR